jgi:hypothetical protein
MMEAQHLYYNIADTLHAAELNKTVHDNVMSESQAEGIEAFLWSLKENTPLQGDLPVKLVCIQGDAGTGKTQSVVSLCQMLPCPIVIGSTNPCSVNVGQRCRSAFPYSSCVQAQLAGTAWAALHWNIGSEAIGGKWEKGIHKIYAGCVGARSAPTDEQDKEIYSLLNQSLFPKMREKFAGERGKEPHSKIYAAWNHARNGAPFSTKEKAMQQLYEMFCSLPQGELTQADFNAALAFRCLTAFTDTLPRSLLSNFFIVEEAARLPAYFFRIIAYYHYMVRYTLKPPGYRDTMLTICFMGSPLQSRVIAFPDFSVMDEAVLDAEKRNTHVSIYTVNRRTCGKSLKAAALATVVKVLENDCPLQEEHARLLEPFVVQEQLFMEPTFAPSAMRLTHYHKRVVEFINKANSIEEDVVTFYEHIFISDGVKAKPADSADAIMEFLHQNGPPCLPYRSNRAKDIRKEGAINGNLSVAGSSPDGPVLYRLVSMKRTLGKNSPISIQHTTRLMPVEFTGSCRSFYDSAALSHSCSEQLWSLRIGLSFANMLCGTLPENEACYLALLIDEAWVNAYRFAQDLSLCNFEDMEQLATISACLTEVQDSLWHATVEYDTVGFVDIELRVQPFSGEERRYFPDAILRGERFQDTVTLEDVMEVAPTDLMPGTINKYIPHMGPYRSLLCKSILDKMSSALLNVNIRLHDLLIRTTSGILFRTVNRLVADRWSAVFPKSKFEWHSVLVDDGAENADDDEPKPKKARQANRPSKTVDRNTEKANDTSKRGPEDNVAEGEEGDDEEEGEEECKEELTSILCMLHTVYDSRVRTIDSVQGDTITCSTFVDMHSIETMGQLTVALTRNTNPDNLMLTSNDLANISPRDPITKFVRLSARDKDCYYVK